MSRKFSRLLPNLLLASFVTFVVPNLAIAADLALVIGLAQGGIQSLSRSMYAKLIPHQESGKYFGFYNMVGKSSAVLGP